MRIVLGVTGGIASYKVTELIREFKRLGHEVSVIPTANALKFIGSATLEALSGQKVSSDVFSEVESVKHVAIGQSADLIVVAPATASFMAKFANGISDDLLGTTLLATKAPIILAPAMHTEMWLNSATVENVSILENRGIHIIQPATGPLTSGDVGAGRLPDAKQIVQKALAVTGSKDLLGKRVLVTAGGTHAGIDAVRFIGNRSSGKQGIAIAEEAFLRGAEVTLVLANVDYEGVVDVLHVSTNEELDTCVQAQLPDLDVLIMAAAIVDYQIDKPSSLKIKRSKSGLTLTLKPSKDLLAGFTEKIRKLKTSTFVVGFAAETATGIELEQFALGKLKGKGCNLLVANDVSDGKVFSKSETEIIIVSDAGTLEKFKGSKYVAARHLVDQIVSRI